MSWYVNFLTMDDETITLAASKLFDSLDDARDHATLFHIRPGWAIPFPTGCLDLYAYPRTHFACSHETLRRFR